MGKYGRTMLPPVQWKTAGQTELAIVLFACRGARSANRDNFSALHRGKGHNCERQRKTEDVKARKNNTLARNKRDEQQSIHVFQTKFAGASESLGEKRVRAGPGLGRKIIIAPRIPLEVDASITGLILASGEERLA